MGKLFKILEIIKILDESISKTGIKVFPTTRPRSVPESMMEFAVVSLPVSVINMTCGTRDAYGLTRTTCRVDVFVRDRKSIENVSKLDTLINSIIGVFPISDNGITISKPSVVMGGSDGYGFHFVTVQASVVTN